MEQREKIWKQMPEKCADCFFHGDMTCLLNGSVYPENEALNPKFEGRYSNCTLEKDKPITLTIVMF